MSTVNPTRANQSLYQEIVQSWNEFWFTPRSGNWLGVIRCLVAILALYWYLSYAPKLQEYFGSNGLFPAQVAADFRLTNAFEPEYNVWINVSSWSLFSVSSTADYLRAVYLIGAAAIVAVIVGWKVHVMTPVATIFVISLMQRAPMFVGSGEALIAMMLIYLSFARFAPAPPIMSLFSKQANSAPQDYSVLSNIVTRLLQIHFTLFLLSMIVAQFSQPAWRDGTGIYYLAARVDSRWLGLDWLRDYPMIVAFLTIGFVSFELALLAVWWKNPRQLLVYLAAVVWSVFGLVSGSVIFPAALTIAGLATLDRGTLKNSRY
jgi:hypothetical protein